MTPERLAELKAAVDARRRQLALRRDSAGRWQPVRLGRRLDVPLARPSSPHHPARGA